MDLDPVRVFKALGNDTRYELFRRLLEGSIATCCDKIQQERACCVTDVVREFGLAQSTISYHLAVLEEAGVIRSEKRGCWTCYFPNRETLEAVCGIIRGAEAGKPPH
ncbi:MAG: helix-turn-helix domain-containing protein [Firmicutes bacterium]|jgi:ArsR family transcriptional regulator|nr:helix-turn-helix domain-containing protein [Bacillota bacterium]